jgi:predicted nucleic acid-binding Zn ribbon protein
VPDKFAAGRPRPAEPPEPEPGGPGPARAEPVELAGPELARAELAGPELARAELAGPELARAAIEAALARRRGGGTTPGGATRRNNGQSGEPSASRRFRPRGYSGPGPDPRDPQPFGAILAKLVKARGWQRPAAEATVFGAWERLVGTDIAAHCRPVRLADGELTVEAESTAWATQLRGLTRKLLHRIGAEVGPNVVTTLHIHGPAAPSWVKGPRRVRGRGPRDTYG